jgi:hypothetical protein
MSSCIQQRESQENKVLEYLIVACGIVHYLDSNVPYVSVLYLCMEGLIIKITFGHKHSQCMQCDMKTLE